MDLAAAAGGDRAANGCQHLGGAPERVAEKGGFGWRRTRHTLTGRQDRQAVDRMGLRLALRRAQADAGDIALIYADESEALTHPYLAHAWAERGTGLRVQAPGQSKKVALMDALDAATGELVVSTSPTKTSADFVALLRRLDWRYGPKPGCNRQPVVLVLDNGSSHASRAALAERSWIVEPRGSPDTVEWLPRYAPKLNTIERAWRDLKQHHLAHQTFKTADDLAQVIHAAVRRLNTERTIHHPCDNLDKAA